VPKIITQPIQSHTERTDDVCEAAGRSFDRAFSRLGANRKSVTSTFEAAVEGLRNAKNPELQLRSIAKSAALATGRCHGNVVETGRCLLDQLYGLAEKHSFKQEIARDQVLLGVAEGACQLGPVVYCRFLEVAKNYKDEAEEWISRNRRLPAILEPQALPVIVPYENELTVRTGPVTTAITVPEDEPVKSEVPLNPEEAQWSRPKRTSIFRRLTEAVGHFFGV
jgi:hypothetical protein